MIGKSNERKTEKGSNVIKPTNSIYIPVAAAADSAGLAAVAIGQRMVSFLNVAVDATSNDSFGRMLCHIRKRACAMCNCHLDDGDYVAINHVWRQSLCHNSDRNEFLALLAAL